MAKRAAAPEDSRPRVRDHGLVVRELGEETIVYDRVSHRAHCLSPALARVFRACDGNLPAAAMARVLRSDGAELDERLLAVALERLRRAGLVDVAPQGRPSRRELLRRATGLTGLALVSIVAPTPLAAASCTPPGECVALPDGSCTGLPCCGDPTKSCVRQGGGRNCTCR
jgi:hypothetical protein